MIEPLPRGLIMLKIALLIFAVLAFLALLAVAFHALSHKPARPRRAARQPTGFSNFDRATAQAPHDLDAHASLIRACAGDVRRVERLIAFEQRKGKPRARATRDALDRLLYERRR
jgi:hypothetical protein